VWNKVEEGERLKRTGYEGDEKS
ncbi:hypothetical protein A2U01_0109175, partial [Trifolium medium]|nr:hypothetical protein [Trifolium medium]